ncbi:MAG: DNA starvation/stationary phase protection protein [Elusimicrobia bacterium]|nr:DNA starvation/stationary phase protection protein [Elusimicrobiota bacterium]MDE2510085.1 DNA starvation/stationary phase protection protein [Elusimicrobiota bacterium]
MNAQIGLKESSRTKVLALLDPLLADEYLLYTKTRNFHWNVTGPQFNDLHKFFESQYEILDGFVDDIAERSRALGGRALGSMKEFLRAARLDESAGRAPQADAMLGELLRDHEKLIRLLREDVDFTGKLGDQGTADFLTGLLEEHEKMAWMLRSFLS